MTTQSISLLTLSVRLAQDTDANMPIKFDGTNSIGAGDIVCFTKTDGKAGELIAVDVLGTSLARISVNESITAGATLIAKPDGLGKNDGTSPVVAVALADAKGGSLCEVLIMSTGAPAPLPKVID